MTLAGRRASAGSAQARESVPPPAAGRGSPPQPFSNVLPSGRPPSGGLESHNSSSVIAPTSGGGACPCQRRRARPSEGPWGVGLSFAEPRTQRARPACSGPLPGLWLRGLLGHFVTVRGAELGAGRPVGSEVVKPEAAGSWHLTCSSHPSFNRSFPSSLPAPDLYSHSRHFQPNGRRRTHVGWRDPKVSSYERSTAPTRQEQRQPQQKLALERSDWMLRANDLLLIDLDCCE